MCVWFLKQYCLIAPYSAILLLRKHSLTYLNAPPPNHKDKIGLNLSYNGATVEVFLLNSERDLWYDGRCG